ncbi:G_PROTEIN_RECEP_F1_2 domain-containing protein [Meloidogyne graminicola]|uniref:G_PROTEIN_RECEP_F1_2 domain-containing protein n=1 Tax=Meloidogyne graminicola TaxID=189291 RepID=A0A8S9ZXA5_9BILA|nr:G_PROTEIN_RECEP_F1_2 domain-containing protein [Meloidogyne graminicola]
MENSTLINLLNSSEIIINAEIQEWLNSAEWDEERFREEFMEEIKARIFRMEMYKIVIPMFLIASIFAILANLIVIAALRSAKVIRTATVVLILSLTFSDIWTSIVVSLSLLYNSYMPIVLEADVNPCISLTLELLRTGGMISATLHLLLIALHHFTGIAFPQTPRAAGQDRRAFYACLIAWIGPFSVLLFLSLGIKGQGYWNCQYVDFYHSRLFRLFVSFLLVAIFILITFFYICLLFKLRANRKRFINKNEGQKKSSLEKNRREMRTTITAILICASFFLGWAPAAILFALTCENCGILLDRRSFKTIFLLSCLQLAFILLKSFLNPLIYSLRVPDIDTQVRIFRHRILNSFGGKFINLRNPPTVEL